ncbi:MAG: beta-lactamase family protein, partial [Bacteroidota bacterium]|nr:beta-lactamase family protein [Bacteroidota bacterium]
YHVSSSAKDSLGRTGSTALLHLVGELKKRPSLKNDIVLLFSSAELGDNWREESALANHPLVRQYEVILKIEDLNIAKSPKLYFTSKFYYKLVKDFAQEANVSSAGNSHPRPLKRNTTLELVQYLGNQPLQQYQGPPENAIYVLTDPLTGIHNPHLKNIDEAVQKFMKKWGIPGGSVAISRNEKLVYARGFGYAHQETRTLVQPEHLFRIASISKPITAVAILKLVQEGKLQLDTKVFGHEGVLSDSTFGVIADNRVKDITNHHLLEHSGGWDRAKSGDLMIDPINIANKMQILPPADTRNIIRFVLSLPLDFAPGSRYVYSNIGYGILGRVIEQITNTPYEDYVTTTILQPLGISNMRIGTSLPQAQQSPEVWYYTSLGERLVPSMYGVNIQVPFAYGGFNLEAMDAHGGWIASAPDLLRFMAAVDGFNNRPDILSPSTLQLMVTPSETLNSGYGLGWWVNSQNNWCHTGSLPGSSALLERNSNGYSWVILFNRRSEAEPYFDELYQLIRNEIEEVQHWPEYDLFQMDASDLIPPVVLPDTISISHYSPKNTSF